MVGDYISREAAIEALVGLTIYDNAPALNAAVEKEYHNGREWIGGVRDALIEIGDRIDRMERQMLNNQLVIMGALDDLIMHGGGNRWAKVHPALIALHDGMASTSAILAQSAEPPKDEVRHGSWTWDRVREAYRCSCCDNYNADRTAYCPNCGARCDGGQDDA